MSFLSFSGKSIHLGLGETTDRFVPANVVALSSLTVTAVAASLGLFTLATSKSPPRHLYPALFVCPHFFLLAKKPCHWHFPRADEVISCRRERHCLQLGLQPFRGIGARGHHSAMDTDSVVAALCIHCNLSFHWNLFQPRSFEYCPLLPCPLWVKYFFQALPES